MSSNCLHERMHNRTGCICLDFLHCGFSNVSSNRLLDRMHNHTGYICLTFPHCSLSNVSSKRWHRQLHSHIGYIFLTFLQALTRCQKVKSRREREIWNPYLEFWEEKREMSRSVFWFEKRARIFSQKNHKFAVFYIHAVFLLLFCCVVYSISSQFCICRHRRPFEEEK